MARIEANKKWEKLQKVTEIFNKEWIRVRDEIEDSFAVDDPVANRNRVREEKYRLMKKLIFENGFLDDTNEKIKEDFLRTYDYTVIIQ